MKKNNELIEIEELELFEKAEEGIFSYFSEFNEQKRNEKILLKRLKEEHTFTKDINKRISKFVNMGDGILFVKDHADFSQKVGYLDIYFVLPKLLKDYLYGIQLWWENKTWYNFKCIFSRMLIFWVLTVESKKDTDRDIFDIFKIQVSDEYFEKQDVIKFTRMWLNKYFPGHNLEVQWLEEEK